MRISDWSSDVCSSDLSAFTRTARAAEEAAVAARQLPDPQLTIGIQNLPVTGSEAFDINADFMTMKTIGIMRTQVREAKRSEERRVGKECVSPCRSRW